PDREALALEEAACLREPERDARLGLVEVLGAVARERDAVLEGLERVLQHEGARLELAHALLQSGEAVLKLEVDHPPPSPRPRCSRAVPRAAGRAPGRRAPPGARGARSRRQPSASGCSRAPARPAE